MEIDRDPTQLLSFAARKRALGIPPSEVVTEHELVCLERLRILGQSFTWIPRSRTLDPTNDFVWHDQGDIEIEMKRPTPRAGDEVTGRLAVRCRRMIRDAVKRASQHRNSVVKSNFLIDLDDRLLPCRFLDHLSSYNANVSQSNGWNISRLWVMSQGELTEVHLRNT